MKAGRNIKVLNSDDRFNIVAYLNLGFSVSKIARRMCWDKSTISREIRRCPQIKYGTTFKQCHIKDKYVVCNQCSKHDHCSYDKVYYNAFEASLDASRKKHESHQGARIGVKDFTLIDKVIFERVKKGQSIEYIYQTSDEVKAVSLSTIRRRLNNELLTVRKIHLKRAKRYQKKYLPKKEFKEAKAKARMGRTYSDFLDFKASNPNI